MTIVDVNILIYATDADAPQQALVDSWLNELFRQRGKIGLPWPAIWGFLRITTDPRLRTRTRTPASALERIIDWLSQPDVVAVQPGSRHLEILGDLIRKYQVIGPLVSDAVLAALAIEHGATLASTDRDFSRFPNLKWVNPLDA